MCLPSVFELVSEIMRCNMFYEVLFTYTHTKNR